MINANTLVWQKPGGPNAERCHSSTCSVEKATVMGAMTIAGFNAEPGDTFFRSSEFPNDVAYVPEAAGAALSDLLTRRLVEVG